MSLFSEPVRPRSGLPGALRFVLLVAGLGAFGFGLGNLGAALGLPVPGFSEMRAESATPAQSTRVIAGTTRTLPGGTDEPVVVERIADQPVASDWPAIFGTPRAVIAPPPPADPEPEPEPVRVQIQEMPAPKPLDLDFTLKGMIVADRDGWALIEDNGIESIYRVGDELRDGIVVSGLSAAGVTLDTSEGPHLIGFTDFTELPSVAMPGQGTRSGGLTQRWQGGSRGDSAADEWDDDDDWDDEDWGDDEDWDDDEWDDAQ